MQGVFLVRPHRIGPYILSIIFLAPLNSFRSSFPFLCPSFLQHVLADTLGSVGVIGSTLLVNHTGWTGWDPIASLFIATLIVASVIPLVIESGKILCLDVGQEREKDVRLALSEVTDRSFLPLLFSLLKSLIY